MGGKWVGGDPEGRRAVGSKVYKEKGRGQGRDREDVTVYVRIQRRENVWEYSEETEQGTSVRTVNRQEGSRTVYDEYSEETVMGGLGTMRRGK